MATDEKISQLTLLATIPATSTAVLQDGDGGNDQAPITGQSVLSSHTPVNYTSASQAITDNLAGIDNALGSIGGNTVSFSVYQSPQQTIPNNAVTLVNFQIKNFDVGSYFNTSTSQYTPLVAGEYLLSYQGAWAAPGTNTTVQFYLKKNGATIAQTLPTVISSGDLVNIPPLTTIVSMNGSTDYVEVYASQVGVTGGLTLVNPASEMYFVGALLNQKASNTTPSTVLQTIYYSTKGSDADGDGTIDFPFATPNAALTYALTLSPTSSAPVAISGDTGTYQIINAEIIYPNIDWIASGQVIWTTDGTVSEINFGISSHFTTAFASSSINELITIDDTLTLNLDASALTHTGTPIAIDFILNLKCITALGVNFKQADTQTFNVNCLSNAILGSQDQGSNPTTIDGIFFTGFPGYSLNPSGNVNVLCSLNASNGTNFFGSGNTGIGIITVTSNSTAGREIFINQVAGKTLNFNGGIDATGTAGIQINLDDTTLPQGLLANITGTNCFFTNLSTQNYYSPNLLTDGSTVAWDVMLAPSALWIPSAASHTLLQITNAVYGQFYQINIQMGATGYMPLFDSSYIFPMGMPIIDTSANANNVLQFYTPDGVNSICTSPALTATNSVIEVTSTSATMSSGYTYIANNASLVTLTLSTLFDGFKCVVKGLGAGGWKVAQLSGQTGHSTASQATTTGTGGSITSTDQYDAIEINGTSSTDYTIIGIKGSPLGV